MKTHSLIETESVTKPNGKRYFVDGKRVSLEAFDLIRIAAFRRDTFHTWSRRGVRHHGSCACVR